MFYLEIIFFNENWALGAVWIEFFRIILGGGRGNLAQLKCGYGYILVSLIRSKSLGVLEDYCCSTAHRI
jgi:hypothetical protein